MGHKVNPIGLRLGVNRTWDSRWFANTGEYGDLLHEDVRIRKFLKSFLMGHAGHGMELHRGARRAGFCNGLCNKRPAFQAGM